MALGQRTKSTTEGTARRILDHARQAFNERGVTAVGIREIARDLDLSPGNVSYHFPTKEDLILALIEEMHAENNAAFAASAAPRDFVELDASLRAVMRRDVDNRWLTRDAVGLLITLPALRPLQKRMHDARLARVDAIVERLIEAKLLDPKKLAGRHAFLRQQLVTQVFFWISATILAAPDRDPASSLDDHARSALALFSAYCTPSGQRQLDDVLARTHR